MCIRDRYQRRVHGFLGSFSTAPAADPLGLYLAVIAEFQGDDRSLAGFWHRLCDLPDGAPFYLSLIHISEPTRLGMISYAVFCLKKKKKQKKDNSNRATNRDQPRHTSHTPQEQRQPVNTRNTRRPTE
eukprot:TRINITY_DN34342_c0_g1_i1.p1 TRINITY_DN34342_c0_g1~~TRINITY_DN34342_c0_g1_i1.p1  ORF type:complete len:128 (-),score=12.54 TRINITY_DN34342_c0_g1_i1:11-394(-)